MSRLIATGGLTRQQVEFFQSLPAADWIFEAPRGKEPYIPAAVVEAILGAGCGPAGWSLDIIEVAAERLSPIQGKAKDGGTETVYTVVGTAKVRISVGARDESGHLIIGADAFHVDGVDAHALTCKSPTGVASLIGNAQKAAVSRAMRSAASRIGPVFGRDVMRNRKDNKGRQIPYNDLVSQSWPTLPEFPCMGDDVGNRGGFSAADVIRRAMESGAGDYDIDDDGDAYDPHTGVVLPAEPARERRAPVEPPAQQKRTEPVADLPAPPVRQSSGAPAPAPTPTTSQRPAASAQPPWMSDEDFARIQRRNVFRGPNGDDERVWVMEWRGPKGEAVRVFVADPAKALAGLPDRLRMPEREVKAIRVRLRNETDDPMGEPTEWPNGAAAQPTLSRMEMMPRIRQRAMELRERGCAEWDRAVAAFREMGLASVSELRNASDDVVVRAYNLLCVEG